MESYRYDRDELITNAGAMIIKRSPLHGLPTSSILSNILEQWEYNGFGETLLYRAMVGSNALFALENRRDNLGRLTRQTEVLIGLTRITDYAYDANGRLTQVTQSGEPPVHYSYDASGNRVQRAGSSGTTRGTYDGLDRLVTYGGASYSHDANGALLSKTSGAAVTRYRYDALNSLVGVTLPGGKTVEYLLDGAQRRVGRKVDGALLQKFLYLDPLHPIAELDGSGQVVSLFVYARLAAAPDYMVKNGDTYRFISDAVGSPRLVVNARTGEIAQRIDYDEFGNVLRDTQPGFQPFGYAGGLYDPDTGLVHCGTREYDPETGRWTTPDHLRFAGGSVNLYEYVGSQPVNRVDPFGLFYFATGPTGGGGYATGLGMSGSVEGGYIIGTSQNGGWKQAGYTSKAMTLNLGIGGGVGRGWSFTLSPLGNVEDYSGDSWTWSISGGLLVDADVTFSMPFDVSKPSSWSGIWKGAITVTPGAEVGAHGWVSTGASTTTIYPIPLPEPGSFDPATPVMNIPQK
jgi:RHS repeat-associated protein